MKILRVTYRANVFETARSKNKQRLLAGYLCRVYKVKKAEKRQIMIQEICARYHNEYKSAMPKDDDYIMFVDGRKVLVKQAENTISYITYQEWKTWGNAEDTLIYLFMLETEEKVIQFFLGERETIPSAIMNVFQFENHNLFRSAKPKELAFAGVTACQLGNWYENTKFCGHCGTKLVHDKRERMMRCPSCNMMHYPKISPAVIIGVINGDKILMTKYAGRDYKKYALIAGFSEIGETVEETVSREVMEEVGLKVKNIRYYKSQPWSFSDTLLLGFFCELDGDDSITLDQEELAVGEWVARKDINVSFDDISLTNEMITVFKKQQQDI